MEQLPRMWGTRQEKCSSCVMLTGIKCKGTCRSVIYLRFGDSFHTDLNTAPLPAQGKRTQSGAAFPAHSKPKRSQRSMAISCLTAKPCPARPAWLSKQLGCVSLIESRACGTGLPPRFLRNTKKSLSVANHAGCFKGPVVRSMCKCEVLEHEEKFSIKRSILKTSAYYCLFWIQYCSPRAPGNRKGLFVEQNTAQYHFFADIGKIRLFLLTCEQSN